ncbi:MAG: VWA domain-containing protein [Minicystis sp.]
MNADHAASSSKRAPSTSIELTVRFGASVLSVTHLTPPRTFHLGEVDCDLHLPTAILGAPRVPLIHVYAGEVKLLLPRAARGTLRLGEAPAEDLEAVAVSDRAQPFPDVEGAVLVPFPLGAEAEIEIAGVTIHVSSSAPVIAAIDRGLLDRNSLLFVGASALAQVGLLGALALHAPPPRSDLDGISQEQVYAIQAALQEFEEKQLEQKEAEQPAESDDGSRSDATQNKEGGTGSRAKGEEGSMGNPNTRATAQRFGAMGPSDNADPHIARAAALREAAEFGMIGLLNSGAGGDPQAPAGPWGYDGSAQGGGGLALGATGTLGHGAGLGIGIAPGLGNGAGNASGFGAGQGRLGGSHRAPVFNSVVNTAPPPPEAQVPAEEAIDPNGRFATTYRPGGGHLSAFESAVARGIVPVAAREIVGDLGARYTPPVNVPSGHALGLRVDLERSALAPGGGAFHLRLALRSSAEHAAARPHLSVHLVLDVSGSMKGESIDRARRAADALVDRLAPTDDFSLTTFSSDASVLVTDGPVGARRGSIHQVIQTIREDGGTNIGAGLELGYAQANNPAIPEEAVKVVLLLSDGHANAGITKSDSLARLALDAFQHGIQTSSFGLGTDYDGALMSSIAADGAGGYYYLRDAEQIAPALSTELDRRLDPVATAVEVRVRLENDVQLLHVYGSRRLGQAEAARVRQTEVASDMQASTRDHIKQDRKEDTEGGMRFFMPSFARDDAHAFLLKLQVPGGMGGRRIAGIELKYKDRLSKKNVVEEIPLKATFADSDAESAASIDASVSRSVQGFAAGETLGEASARIARGDRGGAASLLGERELILRTAASSLHEPLFLRDADRLATLRLHTGDRDGMGDPLVLSMLLETAGRSHLH